MDSHSFCIICGSYSKLKRITHITNVGKPISYLDLFYNCFFIQFLDKHYGKESGICKTCREDLKYCYMFRSKVEKAHKKLYHIMETKETLQTKLLVFEKSLKESKPMEIIVKEDECITPIINKEKQNDYCDEGGFISDDYDMSQPNVSDSEWSTNTDDILTATGFWNELKKNIKRYPYIPPKLEDDCTECPLCEEKIYDRVILEEHYTKHITRVMLCHICGNNYCDSHGFKDHMSKHYGEKFPCPECKKVLVSRNALTYHIKHEHLKVDLYKCAECQLSFFNRSEKDKHVRHVHRGSAGYSCGRCDKVFNAKSTLSSHVRRIHIGQKNHVCEFCPARFFSRRSLRKHLAKHTVQTKLLVFEKSLKESNPMEIIVKEDECITPIINKEKQNEYFDEGGFISEDYDMSQRNVSDSEWSTNTDDILTATGYWNELKKNTKRHPYIPPKLEDDCTECPLCEEKIIDRVILQEHYSKHISRVMLCHICGKNYCDSTGFKDHISKHYGEKFPCPECKKVLVSRNALTYHIKHEHLKVDLYKCAECQLSFFNRSEKDKHVQHVHRGSAGYSCGRCDKVYDAKSSLSSHVRRIHIRQKNHVCEFCSARFFSRGSLRKHLAKHTGIKNILCPVCGKAFGHGSYLRQHLKIHKDFKSFKCDFCDKKFIQKCSLISHIKVHQKL